MKTVLAMLGMARTIKADLLETAKTKVGSEGSTLRKQNDDINADITMAADSCRRLADDLKAILRKLEISPPSYHRAVAAYTANCDEEG